MECLRGEPASSSKTTNGVFFYCGQKPSCNFFCPQNDCSYFHNAIASEMHLKEDMAHITVDKCLKSVYYDPTGRWS